MDDDGSESQDCANGIDSVGLFDSLAAKYDQVIPLFRALGESIVASLDLHDGDEVIDVGCGRGAVALAATSRGAHVVAVDASPSMVSELRIAAPGIDVREMDARTLLFETSAFDVAVAAFVLNVVGNQERVVEEMVRVVRPGGRAVICLPGPVDPAWRRFFDLFATFEPQADAPRTSQPADAAHLLTLAGCTSVSEYIVEVVLDAGPPEEVWAHEMSHGFAGYVASLSKEDRVAFKGAALAELRALAQHGSIRYVRNAAVSVGYTP